MLIYLANFIFIPIYNFLIKNKKIFVFLAYLQIFLILMILINKVQSEQLNFTILICLLTCYFAYKYHPLRIGLCKFY